MKILRTIISIMILILCILFFALFLTEFFSEKLSISYLTFLIIVTILLFISFIKIKPKKINLNNEKLEMDRENIKNSNEFVNKEECHYTLEGISIASSLTEKGYERLKDKVLELEDEMEKYDPMNLSENVSDEKYDRYSEKYNWMGSRLERSEDAITIFELIGYSKNGHNLNHFEEPIEFEFDYTKYEGEKKHRIIVSKKYDYIDFKLYLTGVEKEDTKEKTFRLDRISNVTIQGEEIVDIQEYIQVVINRKLSQSLNN